MQQVNAANAGNKDNGDNLLTYLLHGAESFLRS